MPGKSHHASFPSGVIISPLEMIIENFSGATVTKWFKPSIIPPSGVSCCKPIMEVTIPPMISKTT